jgi:hypothetical protein
VSFCCGDGDCSLFDLGTHQLTKRDSEPESEVRRSASPAALAGSVIRNSSPGPSSLQSHSKRFFTNRRADDTANCRVKREINTTLQIGPQRAVTNIRPCSSEEPCKWTTSEEYSAETAVSSSKSYTVETSTGGEVSISTGVKFLGTGTDISTSLSWSVAESTTEESGYEISTGKVTGISEEFPQVGFSNAFLTFTPIYHCFKADYECEGETLEDVSTCYPQTVGDKETVVGSYNVVYT